MPGSKKHLIPQARLLYSQGVIDEKIGQALGVSAASVSRWRGQDPERWDHGRETYRRKNPLAVITALEDMRQAIIDAPLTPEMTLAAKANAIAQISKPLDAERLRLGDIDRVLGVLGEFAAWAVENATDDERAVLLQLHDRYLAELKRRHST